jgi:hypothetical protein
MDAVKIIDFDRAELISPSLDITSDLHVFASSIMSLVRNEILDPHTLLDDSERANLTKLHLELLAAGKPEYKGNRFEAERLAILALEGILKDYMSRQQPEAKQVNAQLGIDSTLTSKNSALLILNERIDAQIVTIKQEGGFNNDNWKDPASRYPQKYAVLVALKAHLNDNLSLTEFRDVIRNNPKYNRGGFFTSETKQLLQSVLKYRKESLDPPKVKPQSGPMRY